MKIAWERHGEGAPLLLIQGLGYARWGWEPVLEPLARSFDVLLFDNRGIGESDAPPGPYSVGDLVSDALQVLDEAGVQRAHVLGTSLGGMVAQELALTAPDRVDRLVLACTTPGGPESFPMPEQTVKLMTSGATLRQFVENALAPGADDEIVERILRHREATAQPLEAWGSQAAAGATFDALSRIERIAAPTLILHGTEDVVVDSRNSALLALRISDARVELFPGAGHLFFWEQPDRFVQVVREFLR
ncbi:MAG: alpha/beta fold hydrolase [Gaiellaceae bacterium]